MQNEDNPGERCTCSEDHCDWESINNRCSFCKSLTPVFPLPSTSTEERSIEKAFEHEDRAAQLAKHHHNAHD